MMKKLKDKGFAISCSIGILCLSVFMFTACKQSQNKTESTEKDNGDMVIVHPIEIDSSLQNPGRGFATTGRIFNKDLIREGKRYPLAGIVQIRRYWDVLEPKKGQIRFGMIDSMLHEAQENNQQLEFRIMCQGGKNMRMPKWVKAEGAKGPAYYDDPLFLKEHRKFIEAFAKRYDGNPNIAYLDIGSVGEWAEWHTQHMPTKANQKKYIDMYLNNFKKTPLVMQIGGARNGMLHYAINKEAGWRADCWGNYSKKYPGYGGKKIYSKLLSEDHAYNAWKHAPVALEPCWDFAKWYKEGWDIDATLSQALKWHATEVHNADRDIPKDWWSKVKEFEKKLGYRYVLKEIQYPKTIQQGEKMNYSMKWENVGVAPIYHPYDLTLRFHSLKDASNDFEIPIEANIMKWLPGKTTLQSAVKVPDNITSGEYNLQVGLLRPDTHKPDIKLAIAGRTANDWYPLGNITVK